MTEALPAKFASKIASRRRQRGFSLAEVLVAVALLAVILLALFSLISMGVMRAYSGKKMTTGAMLAQAAMEKANVYEAHTLSAASTATTVTQTWSRTDIYTSAAVVTTTPVAVTGTSQEAIERNAWRDLLVTADLPAYTDRPTTLTVTMDAVPAGRTFATATMVRITVNLTWFEWGTRRREVRLQALNLRTTP